MRAARTGPLRPLPRLESPPAKKWAVDCSTAPKCRRVLPPEGRWATRQPPKRATRARPKSPPRTGAHAPPSFLLRFARRQRDTGKLRRCMRPVEGRYRTPLSFCRTDYCHRTVAQKPNGRNLVEGSRPDGTVGRCSLSPVNHSPGTGRDSCGGSGRRSPASPTEVGTTAERRVGRAGVACRLWKHRGRGANRPGRASNVRRPNP